MLDWLKNLFGGSKKPEKPVAPPAPAKPREPEGPKELSPLDAPMIQARIRVLGVIDQIDDRYHASLERTIKARCREKRFEPWWWPLKAFCDERRSGRESNPCFQSFPVKPKNMRALRRAVVAIEAMVSGRRFQIVDIENGDEDGYDPDDPVGDGTFHVRYREGEKESTFPLDVDGGAVDVVALVGVLNDLFRGFRWSDRLFILGPHEEVFGLLHTHEPQAKKAQDVGWGRLVYGDR